MPWHIDSFAPPMNPDVATATFDAMLGDGSRVSLEVATHSFGTTSTIVVPDWRSTKIEGASYPDPLASRPDDVHITTDADAYDGVAAFLKTVLPASGNDAPVIATVWRVFTYREASLAARPLPSLPAEMQMTDLVNGFTFFSNSRVWVLSGIDATHPPWSSASLDGVATVVASR